MKLRMCVSGLRGRRETRRMTGRVTLKDYSYASSTGFGPEKTYYGLIEIYRRDYAGAQSKNTDWVHIDNAEPLDPEAALIFVALAAGIRLKNAAGDPSAYN